MSRGSFDLIDFTLLSELSECQAGCMRLQRLHDVHAATSFIIRRADDSLSFFLLNQLLAF